MAVQSQGRGRSPLLPLSGPGRWDWTPRAKSLGPGHPFLPQRGRGAKVAPLEAALNREVTRNLVGATEGEGLALSSEAWRDSGGGVCDMGGGSAPTTLTGIYWDFCGNVCLGRKNSIALETQSLLCQAESLGGRTISGMPRMANLGICPNLGTFPGRPRGDPQPCPREQEGHSPSLTHSLIQSTNTCWSPSGPVLGPRNAEIHLTWSLNSRRTRCNGETGVY